MSPECRLGRPLTKTSAVSLVEVMLIGTMTGVPFCDTTTVDLTMETEIGTCEDVEPLPPHPTAASAVYATTLTRIGLTARKTEYMNDSTHGELEYEESPHE